MKTKGGATLATITTIKERIAAMDQESFQILCDSYLSKEG